MPSTLRRVVLGVASSAMVLVPATVASAQPSPVCSEFEVGSAKWRQCVEDAATGGGLMPWIVVVPIGVMVLGMFIYFGRRLTGRSRARPFSSSTMGRSVGGWLLFVGLIELAIGIGSAVAARRAPGSGGGYFITAAVLLGVGVLLVLIGVASWRRAARNLRIEERGIAGQA